MLEFLGGGDVGEDHELLDQPMAVQPRPWRDAAHHAIAVDHHAALRQVEIERAARRSGGQQGAECRVQVRMPGVTRVVRALDAFVGEARGAAHQAATEALRGPATVRVDAEFDEQAPLVLVRAQAAPAVGQRLGQHRHHTVGEIHAVAAGARREVERRAGADVVRDVRDGHDQPEAPSGAGLVGLGEHRIVEVARVIAVDGDQRDVAQVGAPSSSVASARSASSTAAGGNSWGMS